MPARRDAGLLLRPVSVAFSKSWNPRYYGAFGLKSDEVEHLRTELSKIASSTFTRVLAKGGYSIASAPGENVLEVQADIVDLVINGVEAERALEGWARQLKSALDGAKAAP
jgi:hypothetical protein